MFVHQKAWADACRVAEGHDPPAVSDVLCAQAADVAAAGDRAAAEELFVRAAKPEKALQVLRYVHGRTRTHACFAGLVRLLKGGGEGGNTGGEAAGLMVGFLSFIMHSMPEGRVDSSMERCVR